LSEERLPTDLWVQAHLRRLSAEATPVALVRRGEAERGTVLLKLNLLDSGCRILTQARDLEGRLGWLAALAGKLVPEAEADAYIARAVERDPDLWVIEIEDRNGRNPFDGKLIG
jgi:hypothetical protein